jgi:hypothetical protein
MKKQPVAFGDGLKKKRCRCENRKRSGTPHLKNFLDLTIMALLLLVPECYRGLSVALSTILIVGGLFYASAYAWAGQLLSNL